jgi:hypothetical protein
LAGREAGVRQRIDHLSRAVRQLETSLPPLEDDFPILGLTVKARADEEERRKAQAEARAAMLRDLEAQRGDLVKAQADLRACAAEGERIDSDAAA